MDARLAEEWNKRKRDCREIRGNILATCFEIEYLLDQIIVEVLIPTAASNTEGQNLLDELFLKGPVTSFRTKIDVLRKLRSRVPRLQSLLPEDTITHLTSIRELRNDFAHYPVAFEPAGNPPQQTLLPLLISRRGRFVLDDTFLEEHGKIFGSTHSTLEAAVKSLKGVEPEASATA
jgi:hypothetical protein